MSLRAKIFNFLNSGVTKDCGEVDPSPDDARQKVTGEVRVMVNRFTAAIGSKDLPTLLGLMTDDVVLLTPSGDLGRQEVEALCSRVFNKFDIRKHIDFAVKTSDERTTATVHAFAFIALTALNGGVVVEMRRSVVGVLRYEDRDWKIARILSLEEPSELL